MSYKQKIIKILLPVIIIIIGILLMRIMVTTKPLPQKEAIVNAGTLVEILSVNPQNVQVRVSATGTVQPSQKITVTPQVRGKVVFVADNFVAGGFFNKGELLFMIEPVDYELAVKKAGSGVATARLAQAVIKSRAKIAREEWQQFAETDKPEERDKIQVNPLVLYEPQLKEAKANLRAAIATLQQAELDLKRTLVYAPFNALVKTEQISLGQHVTTGSSAAVLVGTDRAEIITPLPLAELTWLYIPRRQKSENNINARAAQNTTKKDTGNNTIIEITLAGQVYKWHGQMVRKLGDVDPKSRMARVVVMVDNPYEQTPDSGGQPALAIGMFVNVTIMGKILSDIFVIPRRSLRENSTVWIMDHEQKLRIRQVEIIRFEQDSVLVNQGLAANDKVILTNLTGAADGMKLRPVIHKREP